MSKQHGARQQKRLAKQKAKRTAKRKQLARQNSDNPMIALRGAHAWPVVGAWEPDDLWEMGIGSLVIARRMPDGRIACGLFLVDVFCLGVKDAYWRVGSSYEHETLLEKLRKRKTLGDVSPERLSKLVHCAADYAQSHGFAPHRDFRATRLLLEGIDPSLCHDRFQFGKDGKPLFIAGPHDSPEKSRAIANQVHAVGGHYLIAVGGADLDVLAFDDLEDDGCDDDEDALNAEWL